MKKNPKIEMNSEIMLGKPVIKGTRVTVELILRKLSQGAKEKEILKAYPSLAAEDIYAAFSYAADVLTHEETVHFPPPKPDRKRTRKK